MSSKKKGLGKGLSALLESAETDITLSALDGKTSANSGVLGSIAQVDISSIETNPFQPRTEFEKLRALPSFKKKTVFPYPLPTLH